jgi:hypothetical protein
MEKIKALEDRIKQLESTVNLLKQFVGFSDEIILGKRATKRKQERESIKRAILKSH